MSASFQYDVTGRRRGKTIASASTGFLYDGLKAVQELTSGTPSANIVAGLGLDEWLARTDGSGTSYFLRDALGSTMALADGAGAVQTSYTYEPFGEFSTSGAGTSNPSAFTGREADGSGLFFYRARFYHPQWQRFLSEDPLGFGGGDVNLHAYVSNRPTQLTDPTGLVAFRPPAPCMPNGRKDPPLSWWLLCSPIVVPDVIVPPFPAAVPFAGFATCNTAIHTATLTAICTATTIGQTSLARRGSDEGATRNRLARKAGKSTWKSGRQLSQSEDGRELPP